MAVKVSGGYACGYCGKVFPNPIGADDCKTKHELIYVPITKSDLNRLINFIYLKDESLLTQSLIDTLSKYLRGNSS